MTHNVNFDDGVFGLEAIIDFYGCDVSKFNANDLKGFVTDIIEIADMEAHGNPIIWEDHTQQELHLNGTSIFQWIKTSNIVLHTLSLTGLALLNLFSCKPFHPGKIKDYGKHFFNADRATLRVVYRG